MSYFNMVCDGCGREVQGYNIVNGMKFCAKCYQEIFGNKNMTENLKNMYEAYLKILNEKDQRIAELEEQLKKFTEPKKVKYNKFSGYRGTRFRCPNCNNQIENCIDYTADYYCKHCGQSVIYPKFRVVNNVGELYFEETTAKLRELQGEKK